MTNPFFEKWTTKYLAVPFDQIKIDHYMPAIHKALETARDNIKKLKANPEAPTFENTILALSAASQEMTMPVSVYSYLESAESDNDFKDLADEISPLLSEYSNEINTDEIIFARVKAVYDQMDAMALTPEQRRLLDVTYKDFVRNGAMLAADKKAELKDIDQQLSTLSPLFSKNSLNATNAFLYHTTDEKDIEGLPAMDVDAAASRARQKSFDQGWLFNLQMPSYNAVMTYAKNRELRKMVFIAQNKRCFGDEYDNQDIILKKVRLKHQRANLLGYKTHAYYTLEKRMAESPEIVAEFLDKIFDVAMPVAKKEVAELREFANKLDGLDELMPWDWGYYSEKLKKEKYGFDAEELRPYFLAENCVQGLFKVAQKLYGLSFIESKEIPRYHPDVNVYEVFEDSGRFMGLFYVDLFPRETKIGGAWMSGILEQGLFKGEVRRPHIGIVGNLTPSTPTTPSLLSFDEVETLFHEFGHALHGLLSDCTYTELASPNVYWDFVELPSQIMENWVLQEETLSLFAFHYQTGEVMPRQLIDKVKAARNFNKGWFNVRQLSFGMLDMAWHNTDPKSINDVSAFEEAAMAKLSLLPKVEGTCRSTSFGHIFAGGYSAGYYSYKWAEVLDADAFSKFLEDGIFNKETARSFRENILARGNTEHPMDLFVRFRGRKPDTEAMLRRDGLIK